MRNAIHSLYKKTVEAVTPPLSKSAFEEKRVLTPEEFVAAGDFLVRACPTWSWESGDAKKRRSYFPADKQFLVTRNVPCLRRAADVDGAYNPNLEVALAGEDDWVATHQDPAAPRTQAAQEEIPSLDDDGHMVAAGAGTSTSAAAAAAAQPQQQQGGGGEADIPDIDALELAEDDDVAVPSSGPGAPSSSAAAAGSAAAGSAAGGGAGYLRAEEPPADTILRTRTYDLYITYDQYYQVPRLWLAGYDEARAPLPAAKVLEDVSEEHARKTITVDPHPHLPLTAASIHPCRHAETMKRLVDNMAEGGVAFSVDHYLVLFLKFIASVVPTIQYDYTMSVGQ